MIDYLFSHPKYRAHLEPVAAILPGTLVDLEPPRSRPPSAFRGAALVASYVDLRAARRLEYKRIALMEHGIGQSYGDDLSALPGGKDRDIVDLFLSPNETASARDRARYPKAKHVIVGSPRLDTLPKRKGKKGRTVALTWHTHIPRYPESRSAWEHFRDALPQLAERFSLIGTVHPQAVGMVKPTYDELGIEFVPDFDEVCRRADVLCFDNSSAGYEFASTGGPVVVLNHPAYRRDVPLGLRFDWGTCTNVGIQVDDPADWADAIEEALADPPERKKARAAALKIAYGYRTGAAKRAAKALTEWLDG